jgi:uncharacterized protein (TIGR03437 family)
MYSESEGDDKSRMRAFSTIVAAGLFCVVTQAATINTTLTVTNATGAFAASGITATGPATLTGIGNGTFSGTLASIAPDSSGNLSVAFTITLTGGDKINGTIKVPFAALSATGGTGSATITGGTGAYQGATGSFPQLTATGSLNATTLSISLSFSGAGTITTGGGGPTGPPTPTITSIENNYGLIAPGLPNYALAPSTIFFIQGTNLSNSTTDLISSASPGLPTTLNNVTVSVTAGTTTLQCPLYYLSPTQVDAILPGGTPVGNATIIITNNGAPSAAFPIVVAQSAFGILSYNGTLAAAYDTNFALITATNAANPGQAIVLWGSGVGRDPASDDKLYPQPQNNLTSIPMQAYIGGVQATISYRGRSQFPGLDQVVLTVPTGAPSGCYVSLAIVSGNIVSNSVTIPVATSGKTCTDAGSTIPPDVLSGLAGKTTVKLGVLAVSQATSIDQTGTHTDNSIGGIFQSYSGGLSGSGVSNQVSIGSCLVTYSTAGTGSTPGTLNGLDAGASIGVTGPAGSLTLSVLTAPGFNLQGFYAPPNGVVPASFIPAGGGNFTFDNGSGGKDVGHFNASLTLPPAFTWANASSITSVTRSQGVNVTWTGGAAGTYVNISGESSATISGRSVAVSFTCQAPVSAGQFTVPVPVLLALPAGTGSLDVGNYTNPKTFTATGLDLGYLSAYSSTSKSLPYN